jgi:hypothetical protein
LFRDAGTDHVPHGCSPEVMKEPLSDLGFFARRAP